MNSHDILLLIQYITISVLFVEILIVFLKWNNSIHSYLFLTCISSFISNIGYLFELKAESEAAYITALKLSYVGRVWIAFSFFMFSAKMCRKRIPKGIVAFLVLVHMGIYMSVLTIGSNSLYYPEYQFVPDPVFPKFYHSSGYLHDLLMGMNVIFAIIGITWVIMAFRKAENKKSQMRYLMLIIALGVQAIAFILHATGVFSVSDYYDLTMIGSLLGTIFMLIGILGFDLLGTREIARDFVIDRISEGIIAVDNNGRIQYYNEPAAKLYPEFAAFFSEKTLSDKAASEDEANEEAEAVKRDTAVRKRYYTPYDILSFIENAVENGETIDIGDRMYTPEESALVYRGETYGKLYALVDDTEHYQYMEELQKQRDIADSANEAKSKFLANMSHEIRTPINAVLGMDEMILRESEEKNTRAYASDIMSAGRTLLALINDILDLSKIEEGKMEIIPVQYDLSSLINDLDSMIRDRAVKKGLKFRVNVDEHIPRFLIGDEIRIRQCAMNLLTNAVKYTESGEVTITIAYKEAKENRILLDVTVVDTGIGMKEEDMENLFSPYKRIEEKRNRSIEGTGLGMSITRQLLELMGSSLQVQSEYGKGSVFSFVVEQEVVKREEIGDIASLLHDMSEKTYEYHEMFHAPDAKILVVDDTEMNLTVIQGLLKKTAVQIDTAASGKDALVLAEKTCYDVLFIDHMMPEMDGIETLKHIQESGMCKAVPAVALTANAVSGAREMYLDAGFTDYLSKPVDGEKLEKMLKELLPADKLLASESDDDIANKKEADAQSKESNDPMDRLQSIQALDVQEGLKNCESKDVYLSVLTVFHQTAGAKADEIEALYQNGDIKNYTIKVHALKSSARIVGAASISELAKSLEDAGNKEDIDYIRSHTEQLLTMYRALNAELNCLNREDDSLPMIDEESLKEAYMTMIEIAGSMDYEMMDELLKNLHEYNLPEIERERVAKVEELLTKLDWNAIIQIVGEAV